MGSTRAAGDRISPGLALRLPLSALAALALPAAIGCQAADPPAAPIEQAIRLNAFSDCGSLEQYVRDTAVREMRTQLDSYKPDHWGNWGYGGPPLAAAEGDKAANGSQAPSPSAYTTTNVQVKGVDEPDFMKNDGTRIFTLSGRTLHATRSWPPQSMRAAGSLDMEGYPSAMFLDAEKDRVVVLANVYLKLPGDPNIGGGYYGGYPGACWDIGFGWGCGWGADSTKVTVVDVKDLDHLKVVDEVYLPGNYSNARRVGSSVRVVLSDAFRWPADMKWYPSAPDNDPNWWSDKRAVTAAIDALENDNERLLRAYPIEKWLPPGKRVSGDKTVDLAYSCSDFYAANAPVRLGFITVATINLDKPEAVPARTSLIAEEGQIYASESSLYVASWHWWWWPRVGQTDWFYVHKFDITDPDRATYVASGGVEGHIRDQFSMDEYNGNLRVATTLSRRVADANNPWGRLATSNKVVVLGTDGGRLRLRGQTEELAPGESVQSSRFVGDKGFVVTYRQVDPLFTIDLRDPENPRKIGELTIPGFSTYIHPIDSTHLLTMGIYTSPNSPNQWTERRMQLQVFDVSDLAQPKQMYQQLVGSAYGWSEAAWEHKAFNYFPERKLLAIPFSDYLPVQNGNYWDSFVSDLRVFRVDLDKGISTVGSVNMKDVYVQYDVNDWQWWWSPWIRRSVMASDDQNNDFVYAVADGGVRAVNATAMKSPLATVLFPPPVHP